VRVHGRVRSVGFETLPVACAEGWGKYVVGWDSQLPLLTRLSRGRPWARRKPQVTWRGRHGPGRDWLR